MIKGLFSQENEESRRVLLFALCWALLLEVFYVCLSSFFNTPHKIAICHHDCLHYLRIANHAYALLPGEKVGAGMGTKAPYAFFPLFPLVAGSLSHLLHVSFLTVSLILNSTALACAAFTASFFVPLNNEQEKRIFIAFFLCFPFLLYGYMPYTEALYALCLMLFLVCLQRDYLLWAGMAGIFLGVARPTGCLIIALSFGLKFCLLIYEKRMTKRRLIEMAGSACLSAIGFLTWLLYQKLTSGYWLEFLYAQEGWGRHYTGILQNLWIYYDNQYKPGMKVLTVISVVIPIAVFCYALAQRAFFAALTILAVFWMAFFTGHMSVVRFMYANPVLIAVLGLLVTRRHKWMQFFLIGLMLTAQIILMLVWFRYVTNTPGFLV
ncbi:hypothetical protein FAI40_05230 [Acetobacteraceae bacterium]|nr:hypothetical protein FAI40_05230 [Acetobacteraceae bacterium]